MNWIEAGYIAAATLVQYYQHYASVMWTIFPVLNIVQIHFRIFNHHYDQVIHVEMRLSNILVMDSNTINWYIWYYALSVINHLASIQSSSNHQAV